MGSWRRVESPLATGILIGVSPPRARYFFLRGQEKVPKKKATRRLGRFASFGAALPAPLETRGLPSLANPLGAKRLAPALLVALGLAQQAFHRYAFLQRSKDQGRPSWPARSAASRLHPWPGGLVPASCRHPAGYFLLQLRYSAAPTGLNKNQKGLKCHVVFFFPLVKPSTEGGEDKARRGAAGTPRVRHQHRYVLLANPRADRRAQGSRDSCRRLGWPFLWVLSFGHGRSCASMRPRHSHIPVQHKRKYPAAGVSCGAANGCPWMDTLVLERSRIAQRKGPRH